MGSDSDTLAGLPTTASFVPQNLSWTLEDEISTHAADNMSVSLQTRAVAELANLVVALPSTISSSSLTTDLTARPMSTTRGAEFGSVPYGVAAHAPRAESMETGGHQAARKLLQRHAQGVQSFFTKSSETGTSTLQETLHAAPEQLLGELTDPKELAQSNFDDPKKNWVTCDHCPQRMRLRCEMK